MFQKRGRELIVDIAVGVVWMAYGSVYLRQVLSTGDPIGLGLTLFYTLVAVFFLMRGPNRRECALWETALAAVGVFIPILVLKPVSGGFKLAGGVVQGVALLGIIGSVVSLGRSFGIAPGDRGLVTSGLYRWIRHPLYAMETWFYVGFLVSNPSWRNVAGFVLCLAVHVIRIRREERILSGYDGYAATVRWRMLPMVW